MAKRAIGALLELLLESDEMSSSSSSDEDVVDFVAMSAEVYLRHFDVPPKRPKVERYIDDVVSKYTDEEFRRNFRLSRPTAEELVQRFQRSRHFSEGNSRGGVPPKTSKEHVLSFLWYAGNKACIRDVAGRFGIAESTFHAMMEKVLDFMCDLAQDVIKFPADLDGLAKDFQRLSGFPGVVGCIDGSYIGIRCPNNKLKSTYVNRHHQTSLTLQAVCDNSRRFVDVFTGPPGKMHDARVFRHSFLSEQLPSLCCTNKYHILGDAAYPLREYLITPFREDATLDPVRKAANRAFNLKHSCTRVLIENAFGLLKQRFRQLAHLEFVTVDKCTKFIVACCVLHNLCITSGDITIDDTEPEARSVQHNNAEQDSCLSQDSSSQPRDSALRRLGELKREDLRRVLAGQ